MGLGVLHVDCSMRLESAALLGPFRRMLEVSPAAYLALLFCGCLPPVAASSKQPEGIVIPLTINPQLPTQIELGDMDSSRQIERSVLLENRRGSPTTIARIASGLRHSCRTPQ